MSEIRPIDANDLLSKAEIAPMYAVDAMVCYDLIKSEPTLDYAPVVHAHFTDNNLYGGTMYECSNCKYLNIFAGMYCANCGAKMDEKGDWQNE